MSTGTINQEGSGFHASDAIEDSLESDHLDFEKYTTIMFSLRSIIGIMLEVNNWDYAIRNVA